MYLRRAWSLDEPAELYAALCVAQGSCEKAGCPQNTNTTVKAVKTKVVFIVSPPYESVVVMVREAGLVV